MKRTLHLRFFTSTLFVLLAAFQTKAQTIHFCGSDEAHRKLTEEHPEVLQNEKRLEEFTQNFIAEYQSGRGSRSGPLVIPIVFHIIHQGGSENISDAQVIDQVRILNEDFNKLNADAAQVVPVFLPIVANAGIEFRLANIDPWGNCTNGIERINSTQTFVGNDYSKLHGWPREKYLNIWVVKTMRDGVAGYAYYPSGVDPEYTVPARDGIIILSNYIGSIGSSNYGRARALTHEIGHYLNLQHTWGNDNDPGIACGDDQVDDTPETKGSTSCNLNLQFCNPGILENVENYMDYSYCSKMFTEGQKVRMLAALNSTTADRNNLHSSGNLTATGTDDNSPNPCAPVADFAVSKRVTCVNAPVTFYDASYNGNIDSYYWEFPNGSPSTSTQKNPQVQFAQQGWQVVKLTVSNAQGISVKTDSLKVFVAYNFTLYQAPYYEGFENPEILNQGEWASVNYDGNVTSFSHVDYASHSGSGSLQLNNYFTQADREIDEIVSPGVDLTPLSDNDMKLSFYYSLTSWARNFNSLPDSMVIYASANCGSSWSTIYKTGGTSLVNAGYWEGFYIPTQQQGYWKKVTVNIPLGLRQQNVRFRFQVFSSVRGNNFYIDDINIGNALVSGVDETVSLNNVTLYPNPAGEETSLNLSLLQTSETSIQVYDVTGKEMAQVFNGKLNDGEHRFNINLQTMSAGIYVVRIKAGAQSLQRKLVVK